MTAEELKRLAEIAGIEIQYSKFEGWFWYEKNYNHTPWFPHENIEQAMMVADAFPQFKVGKYKFDNEELTYECVITIDDCEWFSQGKTPAEAICMAALAAGGE